MSSEMPEQGTVLTREILERAIAKLNHSRHYVNAAPATLGDLFGSVLLEEFKRREAAAKHAQDLKDMGFRPLRPAR